jgi:hypothetical protein
MEAGSFAQALLVALGLVLIAPVISDLPMWAKVVLSVVGAVLVIAAVIWKRLGPGIQLWVGGLATNAITWFLLVLILWSYFAVRSLLLTRLETPQMLARESPPQRVKPGSAKEIENRIWEWARQYNLTPTAETAQEGEHFRIRVAQRDLPTVMVYLRKDTGWLIYEGGAHIIPATKQSMGARLNPFRLELGRELLRLGIEHEYTGRSTNELDTVSLWYSDVFSMNDEITFFRNLGQIYRAVNMVGAMVNLYGQTDSGG